MGSGQWRAARAPGARKPREKRAAAPPRPAPRGRGALGPGFEASGARGVGAGRGQLSTLPEWTVRPPPAGGGAGSARGEGVDRERSWGLPFVPPLSRRKGGQPGLGPLHKQGCPLGSPGDGLVCGLGFPTCMGTCLVAVGRRGGLWAMHWGQGEGREGTGQPSPCPLDTAEIRSVGTRGRFAQECPKQASSSAGSFHAGAAPEGARLGKDAAKASRGLTGRGPGTSSSAQAEEATAGKGFEV